MLSTSHRLYYQPPTSSLHKDVGRVISRRHERDELRAALSPVHTGTIATDCGKGEMPLGQGSYQNDSFTDDRDGPGHTRRAIEEAQ